MTDSSIQYGDTVIFFTSLDSMEVIQLKEYGFYTTKNGTFFFKDMVGKPFGSKFYARGEKGYIFVLRLTPEMLASGTLRRKTQIIYALDAAVIIGEMEAIPGKRLVEAGTGSGSLSRFFARAVQPSGHLYTFEYHKERQESAARLFAQHRLLHSPSNLSGVVESFHRDVISEGFHLEANSVDGVFLDLPSPWLVIAEACRILVPGGQLCTFSPCIEQVHKSCEVLRSLGFYNIRFKEALLRPYQVHPIEFEQLTFSADAIASIPPAKVTTTNRKRHVIEITCFSSDELRSEWVATNCPLNRGHTSYLCFAYKSPIIIPSS